MRDAGLERSGENILHTAPGGAQIRRQQITMAKWITEPDRFLDFDELDILSGRSSVSARDAESTTAQRHDAFDRKCRADEAARPRSRSAKTCRRSRSWNAQ